MSSQRSRVASGSVANAVQMGLGFVSIVAFSRLLGPEAIGVYFFVLAVVSTADGLLNGLVMAVGKRIPEVDSNVPELLGVLTYGLLPATVAFSALVAAVLFLTGAAAGDTALFIFLVFTPFVASAAGVRAIIGLERVDLARWLEAARTVLRIALQFALIVLGFGVVGMVVGYTLAMVVAAVGALVVMQVLPRLPSRETLDSVWDFARYSIPGGVVSRLDESADEMLMGLLFVSATVGDYGVAVRLVAPALLVPSVIQGSLSARLSRLESQGKPVAAVLRRNLAFSAVLAMPLFFGALAIGNQVVVTVFGSEFSGAGPFLVILAASRVVKAWSSPMTSAVAGLDHPRAVLVINTISAATMVGGGLLLAVLVGPVGIALGILGAMVVRWLACVVVLTEYASLRDLLPVQIGEQLAAGATMYLLVVWLAGWLVTSWQTVILAVGLGGMAYGLVLLAVSTETRRAATEMTTRISGWDA